jgi:hypothetical protein
MAKKFLLNKVFTEEKQLTEQSKSDYSAILQFAENVFGKTSTTNASRKDMHQMKTFHIGKKTDSFIDIEYDYMADNDEIYMEIDVILMGETDQVFTISSKSDLKKFQKYITQKIAALSELSMGIQKIGNMVK